MSAICVAVTGVASSLGSLLRRLGVEATLIEYSYEATHGFVLSLAKFKKTLKDISTDHRTWWVHKVLTVTGVARVLVVYRDEERGGPISDISFLIPVVEMSTDEEDILICAHPETLSSDLVGLYLEPEGLRQDILADFDGFWKPIQDALESRA
jgi:hypothetical protein